MAYGDYYRDTPFNRAILAHLGYITTPAHTGVSDDLTPFAGYLKQLVNNTVANAIVGHVSDAAPAVTDFDTDLTEASNDHYNGALVVFIDGVLAGQAHLINDYVGATKNCLFVSGDQWTEAPGDGDEFVIIPGAGVYWKMIFDRLGAPAGASLAADIAAIKAETALIVADTGELQTDWHDGGRLDLLIDGIITKLAKPAADATTDATIAEVVGIKEDAAQTTVGTTRSIMAYVKGVLNQIAILIGYHTVPTKDATTDAQMRDVIGKKDDTEVIAVGTQKSIAAYIKGAISLLVHATYGLSALQTLLATTGIVVGSRTAAFTKLTGGTQIFEKAVTSAANAGQVILATPNTAALLIKDVTILVISASPVHLTTAGVAIWNTVPAAVQTLIPVTAATYLNLDTAGECVSAIGGATTGLPKRLGLGYNISINLLGTGADPVNLVVTIEYEACADGGYLS